MTDTTNTTTTNTTTTPANPRITLITGNSKIIAYLGCYTTDGTLYSSNYINSDSTRTNNYISVTDGCYIVTVYYNSTSNIKSYFLSNIISIIDTTTLPTGNITLNFDASNNDINTILSIPDDINNNSITLGTYVDNINKYCTSVGSSTDSSNCITAGNVVLGDSAKTTSNPNGINSTYYKDHNICLDLASIHSIYINDKEAATTTSGDNGGKPTLPSGTKDKIQSAIAAKNQSSTNWWIIGGVILLIIIILAVAGGLGFYFYNKKKNAATSIEQ